MHEDLGSYAYVQRVYNANMRLAAYKLPRTAENGTVTLIADELINLTIQIENGRVKKLRSSRPIRAHRFTCRCLKGLNSASMRSVRGFKIMKKQPERMDLRKAL